ncbi:hypothetical protein T492DRAFT_856962 [Pavlovales sp. CCMP2436]|nr:hypothetical protein T492DRAFT_856962 [Pavlovales sp. CCMP2436]
MGLLRGACTALPVALAAALIGLFFSGALASTGVFKWVDGMGFSPAMHHGIGTPWGFTLGEMLDLTGRVALVTGGNVRLGYWTAQHLAAANAKVIIGCRFMSK